MMKLSTFIDQTDEKGELMGATREVTSAVFPQVEKYVRETYPGAEELYVGDIDVSASMSTRYAGVVVFQDGNRRGFDISIYRDSTFDSLPSRRRGHVDLWDMKTYEVTPVPIG